MPVRNDITFANCDLCDSHKNDTSGNFRVLPPVFLDFGAAQKFGGPVSTVKCFEDNSLVKAAVNSPGDWLYADEDGIVVMTKPLIAWGFRSRVPCAVLQFALRCSPTAP